MPVYVKQGDAIKGQKISAQAHSFSVIRIKRKSGRHRGQFGVLRGNAYCVIDIPMRYVLEKKNG